MPSCFMAWSLKFQVLLKDLLHPGYWQTITFLLYMAFGIKWYLNLKPLRTTLDSSVLYTLLLCFTFSFISLEFFGFLGLDFSGLDLTSLELGLEATCLFALFFVSEFHLMEHFQYFSGKRLLMLTLLRFASIFVLFRDSLPSLWYTMYEPESELDLDCSHRDRFLFGWLRTSWESTSQGVVALLFVVGHIYNHKELIKHEQ